MKRTRILLLSPDREELSAIGRILPPDSALGELTVIEGDPHSFVRIESIPDVLIIGGNLADTHGLELLEHFVQTHTSLSVFLLNADPSADLLQKAMRAGVREVLRSPVDPDHLHEALGRIKRKRAAQSATEGRVIAFVSCKGGSGATFLATNLGYALAELYGKRVALIDLNLQFGDASLFVSDLKPPATLSDIALQIHRLDLSLLASSMLAITPSFGVLAAPEDPAHASDVKPEHIDQLLKLARQHYDFVILDVGRSLDAVSIRALDHATMIFPILQTTLPYIRDGKRLLGAFRGLDYAKEKIHLVVNRHESRSDIKLPDLESAFGTRISRTVPNHYEAAAASVNQGVPILKLAKSSPISKALQEFAAELSGEVLPTARGWLARALKRDGSLANRT